MTALKTALLKELTCRTNSLFIAALVEDYGVEAKAALVELKRERKVDLIATGSLWASAEEYGCSPEALRDLSIVNGAGEVLVAVERA